MMHVRHIMHIKFSIICLVVVGTSTKVAHNACNTHNTHNACIAHYTHNALNACQAHNACKAHNECKAHITHKGFC